MILFVIPQWSYDSYDQLTIVVLQIGYTTYQIFQHSKKMIKMIKKTEQYDLQSQMIGDTK